jgi:hypothetical protein
MSTGDRLGLMPIRTVDQLYGVLTVLFENEEQGRKALFPMWIL